MQQATDDILTIDGESPEQEHLPQDLSLATLEKQVEEQLLNALPIALAALPHDQPLYCLLLCYTAEDIASAWPPFLVWGTESYRQTIVGQGEDVSYYLWAPDEIRAQQAQQYEYWFIQPELKNLCLLHSQLMNKKQSYSSAISVLNKLQPEITRLIKEAGIALTEDFVVSYADNTGSVDPLNALKAGIRAEHWEALKRQKYV